MRVPCAAMWETKVLFIDSMSHSRAPLQRSEVILKGPEFAILSPGSVSKKALLV